MEKTCRSDVRIPRIPIYLYKDIWGSKNSNRQGFAPCSMFLRVDGRWNSQEQTGSQQPRAHAHNMAFIGS